MIDFTIDDVCDCLSYWLDVPIVFEVYKNTGKETQWILFNENIKRPTLYISTGIFEDEQSIINSALWIMQYETTAEIWKENKYDTR